MRKLLKAFDDLLPFQKRWAGDESRWKFGLMSRQVGKDFSAAAEGVREIIWAELHGKKMDWLIAAPSERQSLESLAKWKERCANCKIAVEDALEIREGSSPESLLKSSMIVFPKGSRVIAVPGRPDTVRGYSANVSLTEFAFFEDPDATWRAILPSVTNPMRGGEKRVRLITTPNGIGNKAHDLWVKNYKGIRQDEQDLQDSKTGKARLRRALKSSARNSQGSTESRLTGKGGASAWSCHLVDIHAAVAQGLKVDVEELREALNDPEGWAQEFECQFLDAQAVLLPYELIASCESEEATSTASQEFWDAYEQYPIDLGIDFGRRHDLTVCWANARIGDVAQTMEVLELENMSTPEQVARLRPRLKRARRVCLDYTGAGIGMGDYLVQEFGQWNPAAHQYGKIELCVFSQTLKVELFSKLRIAFEKRSLRVPVSRAVREDLHSVNRVTSANGGITYRAPRGAGGHADRCTALALALRAGQGEMNCGPIYLFEDKFTRRAALAPANTSLFQ